MCHYVLSHKFFFLIFSIDLIEETVEVDCEHGNQVSNANKAFK